MESSQTEPGPKKTIGVDHLKLMITTVESAFQERSSRVSPTKKHVFYDVKTGEFLYLHVVHFLYAPWMRISSCWRSWVLGELVLLFISSNLKPLKSNSPVALGVDDKFISVCICTCLHFAMNCFRWLVMKASRFLKRILTSTFMVNVCESTVVWALKKLALYQWYRWNDVAERLPVKAGLENLGMISAF